MCLEPSLHHLADCDLCHLGLHGTQTALTAITLKLFNVCHFVLFILLFLVFFLLSGKKRKSIDTQLGII